jgi:S-(hydroxymethyl)glutathione dehydrogenase / alcohol dehydrogenase
MRVKAAVALEPGRPLSIETVDLEGPRAGEVLVEIKATGVCHTDALALSGGNATTRFPAILGHEGAGVVVETGAGVRSLKAGDHVIPLYVPECRQCEDCLSGRTNICWSIRRTRDLGVMPDGSGRFSLGGKALHHFMGTSTFAQFTVVPEIALARIRDDAPFDKVCYLGCGVPTGVGAALYTGNVRPGDKVIVFGLGGIGLNVVQGARIAGADMIVGVDVNPGRRAIAEKLGATHFVDAAQLGGELVAHLVALTRGGGDVVFESVGDVRVMRQALEASRAGWGTCVILGLEHGSEEMSFRPVMVRYGRVIKGSYFGGVKGRSQLPRMVDWYMEGKLLVDPLVTHTMPLERINDAFDLMRRGESIRSVVTF